MHFDEGGKDEKDQPCTLMRAAIKRAAMHELGKKKVADIIKCACWKDGRLSME